MRGKRVGTFQADTLDILVYDYLKKQGMTYKDIKMQYPRQQRGADERLHRPATST